MKIKIPLVRPTIDDADIESMISAATGQEIAYGKLTHRFEDEVARYIRIKGGVATNSGTSALHLALRALNVKDGDEVILPSYTCVSLMHAIRYVHAIPVFADINFNVKHMDYNIDIQNISSKITGKTKAIIVPHLFGSPAEIDKIINLRIPVIEDFTQSIGSKWKNRAVGSFGTISIASFHESKVLACGEGGMILTNNEGLLERIKYLADYASDQACQRLKMNEIYSYEERYNYKMSGINAALGLSQLEKIDLFVKKRKNLARRYCSELLNIEGIDLPDPSYEPNIFFRFILSVRAKNPIDVLKSLLKFGIEGGRGVYPPLHYYELNHKSYKRYPITEHALNHVVSIPIYPSLTESEVIYIINCFKKSLKGLN